MKTLIKLNKFVAVCSAVIFAGCLPAPTLLNQSSRSTSKTIVPIPKIFSAQSSSGNYINLANQANFSLSGTCKDDDVGKVVEVKLDDGVEVTIGSPVCGASLTWSLDFDATAYAEGLITITANLKAGLATEESKQLLLTKDVTIPVLGGASSSLSTPNQINNSSISGTTSTDTQYLYMYSLNTCASGALLASGLRDEWVGAGINTPFPSNSSTNLYGLAVDQAGNPSACTYLLSFTHDNIAPDDPTFTSLTPASPSQSNTSVIKGSVGVGATTISFYGNSSCLGPTLGSGTRTSYLGSGITLTFTSDTTTTIYGRAVDAAGNFTNCTSLATYVEDSTPPTAPSSLTNAATYSSLTQTPPFTLTADSTDVGGSGVAYYQYTIGTSSGGSQIATATSLGLVPSNPIQISSLTLVATTTYYMNIYAVDAAGNISSARTSSWQALSPANPEISPKTLTILTNATHTFTTTGGNPAYTYSITSGGGSIVGGTGFFTAPATAQTVTVQVQDSSGIPKTDTATITVVDDTTPPVISSFQLAGGAATTAIPSVSYSISATDDYTSVTQMYMSESATPPGGGDWVTYSSSGSFTLSALAGTKTVYLWLKDGAGNETVAAVTDTIVLDFGTPPTVAFTNPTVSATLTTGIYYTISWSCAPGSSSALATYPIADLSYTTDDGVSFTSIDSNLTNNDSATTGSYSWLVPGALSGTPFRLSVSCKSESGIVVRAASPVMNSSGWSIFTGSPNFAKEDINISSLIMETFRSLVVDNLGNIYFVRDSDSGKIYKIDAQSGYVSKWAGHTTTGCSLATSGDITASGQVSQMRILGVTDDQQYAYLFSGYPCGKIYKIKFSDQSVTHIVTSATLYWLNQFNMFFTKNKILIYEDGNRMYRLELEGSQTVLGPFYGNGSKNAITGAYANGTNLTGLQFQRVTSSGSDLGNIQLMANPDASKVWIKHYTAPNNEATRIDWDGTKYVMGNNAFSWNNQVGAGWKTYTTFDNNIYFTQATGWPAGRWIFSFNTTTELFNTAVQVPFTGNYDNGDLVLTHSSNSLYGAYSLGSLLKSVPNHSGAWTHTKLGGAEVPDEGIGTGDPKNLIHLGIGDFDYNSTSNKMLQAGTLARMYDFSNYPTSITTQNYTWHSNNQAGDFRFVLGSSTNFIGGGSCAKMQVRATTVNIAGKDVPSPSTGYLRWDCDLSGTAYPAADGTLISAGPIFLRNVNTYDAFFFGFLHSTLNKYYFGSSSTGATQDAYLYSSDATTLKVVAGKSGANGYSALDHGTNAIGASLTHARATFEIPSGANQGDILILDMNRLRLITVTTESGSPKIYDLMNYASIAGFPTTAKFDKVYYDFSSEANGLGSGNLYLVRTDTKAFMKATPNSTLTGGSISTYSFDGQTFTGEIKFTKSPAGMLISQPNKNRILRVAP